MDWWYGPAGLAMAFVGLMICAFAGLERIQVAEIAEARGASWSDARRISRELNEDGFDSASFPAMYAYCARHGLLARFWFWISLIPFALLGVLCSLLWDQFAR